MSEHPSISMNGKHFWIMQSHKAVCVLAQIAVKLVSLQQQQQRQQKKEQQLEYNFIFGRCVRGCVFAAELPQLLPESRCELLIFTMGEVCFDSFGRCNAVALTSESGSGSSL